MTHLRLLYKRLGGHVHCRLFSGPSPLMTHGRNGTLVFDENEWPSVKDSFQRIAEVKDETCICGGSGCHRCEGD